MFCESPPSTCKKKNESNCHNEFAIKYSIDKFENKEHLTLEFSIVNIRKSIKVWTKINFSGLKFIILTFWSLFNKKTKQKKL